MPTSAPATRRSSSTTRPRTSRPVKGEAQTDPTHSAVLGLLLEEKLKAEGDEVHLVYPGHKDPEYAGMTEFMIAKLKGSKP